MPFRELLKKLIKDFNLDNLSIFFRNANESFVSSLKDYSEYREEYDAGIFVFHDDRGHFRFSLILATYSGTKRQYTNFRRYTYYVSPELPNKTFINQIGKADFSSIENILAAFSLEAVSDEFYNAFKPLFDEIAESVKGRQSTDQLKQDFALLFAIRIIFLGFVQKRG